MTPGAGILMLGHDHISHCYSEYVLSFTLSIYTTLVALVLRNYATAFLYNCWFLYILWWAVDMQVWSLLTRSQCRVSDTQVTVKAHGPLVLLGYTKDIHVACCFIFLSCIICTYNPNQAKLNWLQTVYLITEVALHFTIYLYSLYIQLTL